MEHSVKKYSNRRLYDTTDSRYITLEDLAGLIQAGSTIRVHDAANGSDLTRQVLTQVILEQQDRLDLLPIELLHLVIRAQGTLEQAPFAAFLSGATRQFVSSGQQWTQQLTSLFGAPWLAGAAGPFTAGAAQTSSAAPAADDPAPTVVGGQGRASAAAGERAQPPAAQAPADPVQAGGAGPDSPPVVGTDVQERMAALIARLSGQVKP